MTLSDGNGGSGIGIGIAWKTGGGQQRCETPKWGGDPKMWGEIPNVGGSPKCGVRPQNVG